MSADLLIKFQALQSNLTQKDLTISQLASEAEDLLNQRSNLIFQVNYLKNSNQELQNQLLKANQDVQTKSHQIIILENECEKLRSNLKSQESFIENWKRGSMFTGIPGFNENSELDRVKMAHSELEARFLREKIDLLENQRKMKDLILQLTDSKSQVLWEKRNKWLASLPEVEKVPQRQMIQEQAKEENLKIAENVQQVLKDVEILLGWKIEYLSDKIRLSTPEWSIMINKQEYLKDWYYNIELSSETLPLLSSPPFDSLLSSAKNYPLLFALILSKHSKTKLY